MLEDYPDYEVNISTRKGGIVRGNVFYKGHLWRVIAFKDDPDGWDSIEKAIINAMKIEHE